MRTRAPNPWKHVTHLPFNSLNSFNCVNSAPLSHFRLGKKFANRFLDAPCFLRTQEFSSDPAAHSIEQFQPILERRFFLHGILPHAPLPTVENPPGPDMM